MLSTRWLNLCDVTGIDGRTVWPKLIEAYSESSRAYHNLDHIADCLSKYDDHAHLAADPPAVEFAIWFHDIVYDTHAQDNEEQSALLAFEFLSQKQLAKTVSDLINATKHDLRTRSRDADLHCDIDLSVLGRDGGEYDTYAHAIRQEYAWVSAAAYKQGRIRFLEGMLTRQAIFTTDEFAGKFEEQARWNIAREIAHLSALVENSDFHDVVQE